MKECFHQYLWSNTLPPHKTCLKAVRLYKPTDVFLLWYISLCRETLDQGTLIRSVMTMQQVDNLFAASVDNLLEKKWFADEMDYILEIHAHKTMIKNHNATGVYLSLMSLLLSHHCYHLSFFNGRSCGCRNCKTLQSSGIQCKIPKHYSDVIASKIDCLFNSLFRQTATKESDSTLLAHRKETVMWKEFPLYDIMKLHDVIMTIHTTVKSLI